MRAPIAAVAVALALVIVGSGCGGTGPAASASGKLEVVAAEAVWGSIAQQLGGERVAVSDIVANPAADPHDYEPSAADARTMAGARIAIVNGIGYDPWATRLLEADPSSGRTVLTVGELLGLSEGDNPHQWYSPTAVRRVIGEIAADYIGADPRHASYFEARRRSFEARGLAGCRRLISQIRSRYAGTPVGASESIFEPLAPALGLKLITPRGFMDAVSQGSEPTPADRSVAERQIADRRIGIWIYNSQNATPDVQRLNDAARAAGIPIATLTETPAPEGASFQAWMTRELRGLRAALARAGAGG